MKRLKNIYRSLLILAAILIVGCAASNKHSLQNSPPQDILAKVGDNIITLSEFEETINAVPPQYRQKFKSKEQKAKFLERLVETALFSLEARAEKIDREKTIESRIQDTVDSILAREYIKRNVTDKITVTDDEISQYYQTHLKEFTRPEQVKARHILIRVDPEAIPGKWAEAEIKARELKNRLDNGANFATLAKEYSDDAKSKNMGGDLGFFAREKMAPEFSEAVFSLRLGEIRDPVKTSFGYHIIKVEAKRPERIETLEKVKERIQYQLKSKKYRAGAEDAVERLKEKYEVILNTELLKS
jgi:peptidyl-prolyl cis-trans isomerase C